MKKFIGTLIIVLGVVLGLYIGGWLMFIQPIVQACVAFDAGALTGLIVGVTILKCIFASFIGILIALIGIWIGSFISYGYIKKGEYKRMNKDLFNLLEVETFLNEVGIKTRVGDASSNFRNFKDILNDLIDNWDKTNEEEKKDIIDTLLIK